MKKFFITKTQPVTQILTYYVEAESEEEAISKIEDGDLVNVYDNTYAELSKGSRVCKEVVNKFNTILRAK
jgi:capsular polysaccharide biosynthesis protein